MWVMEVLHHRPRSVRRGPIVGLLIVMVGVLLVLVATSVNSWQRDRTEQDLQDSYEQAIATLESAQARVRGTVSYASPLLHVGPPEVRASLEDVVLEEVAQGTAQFERARQAVQDIQIWPWHDDVLIRQSDLLADLDRRARPLTEATGQGLSAS